MKAVENVPQNIQNVKGKKKLVKLVNDVPKVLLATSPITNEINKTEEMRQMLGPDTL